MALRRLFHNEPEIKLEAAQPAAPVPSGDTESIRRISAELEALPIESRRFIAGYAYVLARVAHADLDVSEPELAFMEHAVVEVGHLSEPQAVLVVEMARNMNETLWRDRRLCRHARVRPAHHGRAARGPPAHGVRDGRGRQQHHRPRERGAQRGRQGAGVPGGRGRHHPRRVLRSARVTPGDAPDDRAERGGLVRLAG